MRILLFLSILYTNLYGTGLALFNYHTSNVSRGTYRGTYGMILALAWNTLHIACCMPCYVGMIPVYADHIPIYWCIFIYIMAPVLHYSIYMPKKALEILAIYMPFIQVSLNRKKRAIFNVSHIQGHIILLISKIELMQKPTL